MGWGGLSHYANVLDDLELFFSSCPPSAQRRSSPPPAPASSAHPAGHLRRRWGPRGQRFRSIPGVPRRGGRRPRKSAKCRTRFSPAPWDHGGRPGPHRAQIAPRMPGQPSANQVGPQGVANGLAPGVGGLGRLREFSGRTRIVFFRAAPAAPSGGRRPPRAQRAPLTPTETCGGAGVQRGIFSGRIPEFRAGVGAARGNRQSAELGFLSASGVPAGAQAPTGLRLLR